MPTFATIYDAYRQSQPQNLSLEDFSRLGNLATGSENFNEGVNGWFGGGVKRGSYWLDRGWKQLVCRRPLPRWAEAFLI